MSKEIYMFDTVNVEAAGSDLSIMFDVCSGWAALLIFTIHWHCGKPGAQNVSSNVTLRGSRWFVKSRRVFFVVPNLGGRSWGLPSHCRSKCFGQMDLQMFFAND